MIIHTPRPFFSALDTPLCPRFIMPIESGLFSTKQPIQGFGTSSFYGARAILAPIFKAMPGVAEVDAAELERLKQSVVGLHGKPTLLSHAGSIPDFPPHMDQTAPAHGEDNTDGTGLDWVRPAVPVLPLAGHAFGGAWRFDQKTGSRLNTRTVPHPSDGRPLRSLPVDPNHCLTSNPCISGKNINPSISRGLPKKGCDS